MQFLDVPNLSPFLLGRKLLVEDEYMRLLQRWADKRMQESVVNLLLCISHKPNWGQKLLKALEDSINYQNDGGVHYGHVHILKELQQCKVHYTTGLEKVTEYII